MLYCTEVFAKWMRAGGGDAAGDDQRQQWNQRQQWKNQRAGKLDCKLDLSIVRLTEIRIRG